MKMKVAIIYDKERAVGNERFSLLLSRGLEKRGIECITVLDTEYETLTFDIAVMRTFNAEISRKLSANGIPCLNNLFTQETANDKAKTYELLEKAELPFLPYKVLDENTVWEDFPAVVKSAGGHGGTEVFMTHSKEELSSYLSMATKKKFIVQKCSDNFSDKRVYVIGGEPIIAMRRSNSLDFRSNYKLGGKAEVCEVSPYEKYCITQIQKHLNADYIGIDFLTYGGREVINEIEDIVGCRMVYENSDVDLLDLYADYINKIHIRRT